jgi:hypothetical protein
VAARLALAGSRTDRLRVALTIVSSALASLVLLAAATVAAVPELASSDDGSDGWNNYSSDLIAQPGLRPGVVLTLLLLAVPILVLAGHSVRFGSPARDRRLAAVRLAGGTRRQAVLLAAVETGLSALAGSVVGLVAYVVLRRTLHRPGPDGRLPLPTDIVPPVWGIALILLIVPVLATAAAAVLLRHVLITPLGVVRRTRDKRPSVLPGVLILGGIFTPIVIRPVGEWIFGQLSLQDIATGVVSGRYHPRHPDGQPGRDPRHRLDHLHDRPPAAPIRPAARGAARRPPAYGRPVERQPPARGASRRADHRLRRLRIPQQPGYPVRGRRTGLAAARSGRQL